MIFSAVGFINDGSPVGESFQVFDDTTSTYQTLPQISVQSDGRFIITWTDLRNGTYDIFAQRFWSDGSPYSGDFLISNTDELEQSFQSVILENNLIYSVWQDNRGGQNGYDIWANVLDWDTGVGIGNEEFSGSPDISALPQNFPNPFKTSTTVSFSLEKAGTVQLNIYDLRGQLVSSKNFEFQEIGIHNLDISAGDLPGGIYLYRVIAGGNTSAARKMVLLD